MLLPCITGQSFMQAGDTVNNVTVLPVPALGYTPETRAYIGAVALFTFNPSGDSVTRTSTAKLEFNATLNRQYILEAGGDYFLRQEKWRLTGLIHLSTYPDYYYGIGSNTPESNRTPFNSNRFLIDASLYRKVGPALFSGLRVKYLDYRKVKYEDNGIAFPELVSSSVFGAGYSLLHDSRNSILTPVKGWYFLANGNYNFSDTRYAELTLDLRYYTSWKSRFTFSNRLLNDFTFGNPPFFDFSLLGGDRAVRGYELGR